MISTSPSLTVCPAATSTFHTVPAISERTVVGMAALRLGRHTGG